MEKKRIAFLVNLHAGIGRGKKRYCQVLEWLNENAAERGIEPAFFFTEKSGEKNAANLARAVVKDGYDILAVIGGDGTLNEVANGMLGSGIPVLIIPAGNGNDFAKALRIPKSVETTLELIDKGQIDSVDLGKVNNRVFVNIFGVGFVAEITQCAETLKHKLPFAPNALLYLIALLRELSSEIEYPHVSLRKSRSKTLCEEMVGRVTLLMVSNGYSCGGIFKLAPDADVKDGLLDVCFIKKTSRWRILWFIRKGIRGTHLSLHEVKKDVDGKLPRASQFVISSLENQVIPCQMDGELLPAEKQYRVSILPKAFKVLVPAALVAVQRPLLVETRAPEYQSV